MPTYEYACRSCKRHTEAVQSFTDPPLTECPHCGGELKRVFHPVGIVLKGSGFYSTDNRSSKRTLAGTKDGPETASAADAASGSGSETAGSTGASKSEPAADTKTKTDTAKESKPAKKETKKPEPKK